MTFCFDVVLNTSLHICTAVLVVLLFDFFEQLHAASVSNLLQEVLTMISCSTCNKRILHRWVQQPTVDLYQDDPLAVLALQRVNTFLCSIFPCFHLLPGDPCRTTTPSSGHFSAGSKVSSPSPPGQEGAGKLRRELESLRKRHSQEQRDWREERRGLVELVKTRGGSQEEEISRNLQISLVEEKIREVLAMLRSLNTMNISEEVLGRMVVEAVEQAYDPVVGEVAVFRFLALLYSTTRDYERKTANSMLERAIKAVGDDSVEASDSSSSSSLGSNMPGRMATLRPRRPQERLNKDEGFQIHV